MSRRPLLRVLVVEDDPRRIAVLRRRFRSAAVTVATNYADAVKSLAGDPFDIVLLDHDLDDRARNGQDIAAWMATRLARCRRPAVVVVHSTNQAGSLGICQTLAKAGFEVKATPFSITEPRMTRAPFCGVR